MRTKKGILEELNEMNSSHTKLDMKIAEVLIEYEKTKDEGFFRSLNYRIQESRVLFNKIQMLDIELKEVTE